MIKLIIAGSRNHKDPESLMKCMVYFKCIFGHPGLVLCGLANGVDTMGETWAKVNKVDVKYYKALWEHHGKKAGFIRNQDMGKDGTHLILIWDGESPGSRMMQEIAIKERLKIIELNFKTGDVFRYGLYKQVYRCKKIGNVRG